MTAVKILLERGASLSLEGGDDYISPFLAACNVIDMEVVFLETILARGVNIFDVDRRNYPGRNYETVGDNAILRLRITILKF